MPVRWVERLFERLTAIVGSSMGQVYAGADPELVKAEWAEALGGFSSDEVARGISSVRLKRFPPNLPEFLHLCRPALDPEIAWHEAEAGMRSHAAQQAYAWSHPAVFWAAREFGHELRTSSFQACRKRWEAALAAMWTLRAWPEIPDPTARRIEQPRESLPANPQRVSEAMSRLQEVRKTLAKAIEDSATEENNVGAH